MDGSIDGRMYGPLDGSMDKWMLGWIDLSAMLPIVIASFFSAPLGVRTAALVDASVLRRIFSVILLTASARMLYTAL